MKTATAFAPASVGNAAVGFDILGFPVNEIGDIATVKVIDSPEVVVEDIADDRGVLGGHRLPVNPTLNTAAVALNELRKALDLDHGFSVSIRKGIPIGSGMGGSAASAVAACVAANALLDRRLSNQDLFRYALLGEIVASGTAHSDNVAPCLFGGLTLTVCMDPVRSIRVPVPSGILCVLVHPHIRLDTLGSRSILKQNVPLRDYVGQSANLAGFLAGCYTNDVELIRSCFADVVIEPQRSNQIPGFEEVKAAAISNGALGAAISGSGPSVFAWTTSREIAEQVRNAMLDAFLNSGLTRVDSLISPISQEGARLIT